VRDGHVASFHGALPGELAVEWFARSGAADEKEMNLVGVAAKRGRTQGLPQERGVGDVAVSWSA
jgi:hypothetical protein